MKRTRHLPLWTRILLLAMLNLALLAGMFVVFLRSQLQPDLESFLMAGARARIAALTAQVALDLQSTDSKDWDALFQRYSEANGVRVLLYRNTREQLAGTSTVIPSQVEARMPPAGPGPRSGRGGGQPSRGGQPPDFGERGRPGNSPDRESPRERGGPQPGGRGGPGGPQDETAGRPFLVTTPSAPKYWVGIRMPVINRPDNEQLRSVLLLVSNSFFLNPFFFEAKSWLGLGLGALLISVVCWLPLVRNLTRWAADMRQATGRIADGRFDVEVNTQRNDELGQLGASIKQMAGRLQSYTEGRTRFLGSVAHELRSPIARMQLAAEILERHGGPESQKYIDYLKEDIDTMSRLTDELLQVARAESAPGPVRVQPVSVAEAVQTAIRREAAEGAHIQVDVGPSIKVQANMEYLVRAIGNVVRNAVRYAGEDGPVTITGGQVRNEVVISISDRGPGVPEADLDRIFMPFYRVDDARDRRTGGTGLGLAIVRSCIEACGGSVAGKNMQPSGLEVTITLPAA